MSLKICLINTNLKTLNENNFKFLYFIYNLIILIFYKLFYKSFFIKIFKKNIIMSYLKFIKLEKFYNN